MVIGRKICVSLPIVVVILSKSLNLPDPPNFFFIGKVRMIMIASELVGNVNKRTLESLQMLVL